MECDICSRHGHQRRLPFYCPVDVRNQLYEGRIALADALIENEHLETQVDTLAVASTPSSLPAPAISTLRPERARLNTWRAEEQAAVDRTNDIIARADRLRADVDAARREIEDQRAANDERKAALAAESATTPIRRTKQLGESERALHLLRRKWDRDADNMAATRGFLCMEAGKLYGLRRIKKGSAVHYEIGGLEIMDLATMNMLLPEVISTCLAHITHILVLASHYLAIRLPAEITLPHRDYPRPTVFTLQSSYKTRGEVPFPGTSVPQQPSSGSKDGDGYAAPRPRPLFVDKPLLLLAKEDPVAHKLFIEGVALLAYNVAWACCSQGVPVGGGGDGKAPAFDDVTHLGRNLYNLLIGGQLPNNPAGRLFPHNHAHLHPNAAPPATGAALGGEDAVVGEQLAKGGALLMGRYSHGTAHAFLGDDAARAYRLPNPKSLTDRLRTRLSSDGPVADWEVLEDDAWAGADDDADADDDAMEAGVLARAGGHHRLYGVESVATVRAAPDDAPADGPRPPDPSPANGRPRGLGLNGWTKLKPR